MHLNDTLISLEDARMSVEESLVSARKVECSADILDLCNRLEFIHQQMILAEERITPMALEESREAERKSGKSAKRDAVRDLAG